MNKKLIFMHLPKCGGTTFHSILDRMYSPKETFDIKVIDDIKMNTEDFIALPSEEKEKIRLLKGHLLYGLHEQFKSDSEYITFLRNPVDRVISIYYYVKRRPKHRLRQSNQFNDDMSIYDFVTKINDADIKNGQIRCISGIQDKPEMMLEKALENIEKHFSFVGTTERFNESLIILQKMYGWSTPYYRMINQTQNRPKIHDIDKKDLEAIEHFNTGDIQLYNKMNEILEAKLKKEVTLEQELSRLNTISKIYSYPYSITAKGKKLLPEACKNTLKRLLKKS